MYASEGGHLEIVEALIAAAEAAAAAAAEEAAAVEGEVPYVDTVDEV